MSRKLPTKAMNIVDNVIDRRWTNRLRKTKKRRREKKEGEEKA